MMKYDLKNDKLAKLRIQIDAVAQMLINMNFLKISIKICKDDCFDLFVLTTLINEHPLKVPFAFV